MSGESNDAEVGALLELLVHDLKSPLAGLRANLGYVRSIAGASPEVDGALEDCEVAVEAVLHGLEHLRWIGRALAERPAIPPSLGDVCQAIRRGVEASGVPATVELPEGPIERRCAGAPLEALLRLLVASAGRHGADVRVRLVGDHTIEVLDSGRPIPDELRARAFRADGQADLKTHPAGRYAPAAGLYAVGLLADAVGAVVEAEGVDGEAIARVRFVTEA